jgi:hypothetical protein
VRDREEKVEMKAKLLAVSAVFGAFVVSGPLQHIGVLPQTAVGDASKAMIKAALNLTSEPAFASCRGGNGGSHGWGGGSHANNGFGNGGHDGVPGHSQHQDNNR